MKKIRELEISQLHLAALVALASMSVEKEVCGLMGGTFRRDVAMDNVAMVKTLYPIDNIALNPTTTFRLDERQQIRALYSIAKGGEEFVGIFHSHPHGPDRPSASDLGLNAYPEVVYCILFPEGMSTRPLAENYSLYGGMVLGAWQLVKTPRPIAISIR